MGVELSHQTIETPSKRNRQPPKRFGSPILDIDEMVASEGDMTDQNPEKESMAPKKPRGRQQKSKKIEPNNNDIVATAPPYMITFNESLLKHTDAIRAQLQKATNFVEKELDRVIVDKQKLDRDHNRVLTQHEDMNEKYRLDGLKRMEAMGFHGEPDDKIQETFKLLLGRVKRWSAKHGAKAEAMRLSPQAKTGIINALATRPKPATTEDAMTCILQSTVSATILLNALFNKLIYEKLACNRFFFLEGLQKSDSEGDLSKAVVDLWKLGDNVNPQQANVWLSQTMMLLHPKKSENVVATASSKTRVEQYKKDYYYNLTKQFLTQQSVDCLLQEVEMFTEKGRFSEAYEIISATGDYLLRIGLQKVLMKVVYYDDLKNKRSKNSLRLKVPHPCLMLEDDDESFQHMPVSLIVEPAILAYGDEDGKNYDQPKLWHQAVVLALKNDKQSGSSASAPLKSGNPTDTEMQQAGSLAHDGTHKAETLETSTVSARAQNCDLDSGRSTQSHGSDRENIRPRLDGSHESLKRGWTHTESCNDTVDADKFASKHDKSPAPVLPNGKALMVMIPRGHPTKEPASQPRDRTHYVDDVKYLETHSLSRKRSSDGADGADRGRSAKALKTDKSHPDHKAGISPARVRAEAVGGERRSGPPPRSPDSSANERVVKARQSAGPKKQEAQGEMPKQSQITAIYNSIKTDNESATNMQGKGVLPAQTSKTETGEAALEDKTYRFVNEGSFQR